MKQEIKETPKIITNEVNDSTKIKVVGLGGGGGNAVNRMVDNGITNVDFIAMNTDSQVLQRSKASQTIQLGERMTAGRGAGANPEIGRRSAEESSDEIKQALNGAQMVFLTAGMGGGTGTGAIPVVAKIAKESGILTIGIVTKPFAFEGRRKMRVAEAGIAELLQYVDSLIIVPNERLKAISKEKITLQNAFAAADSVLQQGIMSISSLVNVPAFINLDFADVRAIMKDAGYAHMGMGFATGNGRALAAAEQALHSPLIETAIDGATGIIINITASPDIELEEIENAATHITNSANPEANIIWGVAFDDRIEDGVCITMVATGFEGKAEPSADVQNQTVNSTTPLPNPVFADDVYLNTSKANSSPDVPDFSKIMSNTDFDDGLDAPSLPKRETTRPAAQGLDEIDRLVRGEAQAQAQSQAGRSKFSANDETFHSFFAPRRAGSRA